MKAVPRSELAIEGLGTNPAVTSSNEDLTEHLVKYAENVRVEDLVFFHEFCHVKLNEMGFRRVEAAVQERIAGCCSSEAETLQMRIAGVIVAETLADSLLYRFFREESEDVRNRMDYSYLMRYDLRTNERKYGFQVIAQAAAYRVSKERAGLGDQVAFGYAIREAFGEGAAAENYDSIFAALSKLPVVGDNDIVGQMDGEDIKATRDCVLRIFEIRTGKKCA